MSRSRKSARASIEPPEESPGGPGDAPFAADESGGEGPNKSDAARQAIRAGYEKPAEAVAWIKTTFGIDMNPQHFSAIKSNDKKKQEAAISDPARRGPRPGVLVEGYVAPPERPKAAGEPDILLALEDVKQLVSQFGADRVKRMVDLLG
jgi:hypothetical protein